MDKSDFEIGAQLFTLRDRMKTKEDISSALFRVADMGYTSVQLSAVPIGADEPKWFKAECDKNGLRIVCTHSNFDRMRNDLDGLLDDMNALGCSEMGIGCMPEQYRNGGTDEFKEFAEIIDEIAVKANRRGINLLYHNHRFEFAKSGGKLLFDILAENAPHIKLLPDLYWVTAGGILPIDFLEKHSGRYTAVHYKDYGIRDNKEFICEIGRGNIDYITITKYLLSVGVSDILVEQDSCDGDEFDSLKSSIDYIKNTILPQV